MNYFSKKAILPAFKTNVKVQKKQGDELKI